MKTDKKKLLSKWIRENKKDLISSNQVYKFIWKHEQILIDKQIIIRDKQKRFVLNENKLSIYIDSIAKENIQALTLIEWLLANKDQKFTTKQARNFIKKNHDLLLSEGCIFEDDGRTKYKVKSESKLKEFVKRNYKLDKTLLIDYISQFFENKVEASNYKQRSLTELLKNGAYLIGQISYVEDAERIDEFIKRNPKIRKAKTRASSKEVSIKNISNKEVKLSKTKKKPVRKWLIENKELGFTGNKSNVFIAKHKQALKENGAIQIGRILYVENINNLMKFVSSTPYKKQEQETRIRLINWLSTHKELNFTYNQARHFLTKYTNELLNNGAIQTGKSLYVENEKKLSKFVHSKPNTNNRVSISKWLKESKKFPHTKSQACNFLSKNRQELKENGAIQIGNYLYVENEEKLTVFIKLKQKVLAAQFFVDKKVNNQPLTLIDWLLSNKDQKFTRAQADNFIRKNYDLLLSEDCIFENKVKTRSKIKNESKLKIFVEKNYRFDKTFLIDYVLPFFKDKDEASNYLNKFKKELLKNGAYLIGQISYVEDAERINEFIKANKIVKRIKNNEPLKDAFNKEETELRKTKKNKVKLKSDFKSQECTPKETKQNIDYQKVLMLLVIILTVLYFLNPKKLLKKLF